jgi:hypothetical protein
MRKRIFLPLIILLGAAAPPALVAKALGPPIEHLLDAPERIRIVVAVAREKTGPDKIRFAVGERLSGEAPDEVILRTDANTHADVAIGTSYLVAFSYLRKERMFREGWEEDPEGPSIVSTMGLSTVALFEPTPGMKHLFSPGAVTNPDGAGRLIDALLELIPRADRRARGLAIEELFLRRDLTGRMDAAGADKLRAALQTAELDPRHHDWLLQAASRVPPDLTAPWLGEELRRIIITNGTQYDPHTFIPTLVRTAAEGLKTAGNASDVELLSLLLYASNPGVAKAALATMTHLDKSGATRKAEQALARGWILDETRRVLTRFLEDAGT